MMNVQVRGVPDNVHRRLRAQAALSGQSLNEYLSPRAHDGLASAPTIGELAELIGERAPYARPPAPPRSAPTATRAEVLVVDANVAVDFLLCRPSTLLAVTRR